MHGQVFLNGRVHERAGAVRQVPQAGSVGRNGSRDSDALRLANPFVVAEDESAVLADGSAGCRAELIAPVRRSRLATGVQKEIVRVQLIVPQELIYVAMEIGRASCRE